MIRVFIRTGLAVATAGMLVGCLGCEPPKPIRSYSVPKPELVYEANHVAPIQPQDAEGNPLSLDDRMLTALIPHGETAWYVKLSGPEESIAPQVEAFQAFVKSFKFAADPAAEPAWQLNPDWTSAKPEETDSPSGISPPFAIVTIGKTDPPLQIRITSLPLGQMDLNSYMLLNVNRWRRQLSLRDMVMPQMKKEMQKVTIADGTTAYSFDMLGKLQAGGMPGAPPMAGHPPLTAQRPEPSQSQPSQQPAAGVKFQTPSGWHEAENDAFSKVALETGEGAEKVRVTFSTLPPSASKLVPNVNRWRGQIGLDDLDEKQVLAGADKMDIGGLPGRYVEIIGPEEAIFGAIVVHPQNGWFLKMRGPKAATQAQQANFRELLKSIRFE